jgi:hypothetical protein
VVDDEEWRPASNPDPLTMAIAARTDHDGRVVLRSDSNRWWGTISAWAFLGLAAAANNATGLRGPDALTPGDAVAIGVALVVASLTAQAVLGGTYVAVDGDVLLARNPLHHYSLRLDGVRALGPGFWGFPVLRLVDATTIRVFGLGESSKDVMEDGSEDAFHPPADHHRSPSERRGRPRRRDAPAVGRGGPLDGGSAGRVAGLRGELPVGLR